MRDEKRLNQAYKDSPVLPLTSGSKYILFSDCHRSIGTSADIFLKNQTLYFAALQHYFRQGYTYIELGDGDELWQNRSFQEIASIHSNVFWLLSKYYKKNRLYMIYGNHDIVKSRRGYAKKNCSVHYNEPTRKYVPLFPDIQFYPGIRLQEKQAEYELFLTHGHQVDFLNSAIWPIARFLVRYLWTPLENIGVLDPTSAAKNYTKKNKTERKLSEWADKYNCVLIAGHTHRPMVPEPGDIPYFNTGSCVHPRCITGIEIHGNQLTLIKWTQCVRADNSLAICREELDQFPLNQIPEQLKSLN